MELLVNDRENCDEKLADARYIPSTSVVSKLRKAVIRELGDSSSIAAETCSKVTARELRMMLGKVPASTRWRPSKRRCIDNELKFSDTLVSPSGCLVVVNSMPKNGAVSDGGEVLQPLSVSNVAADRECEMVQGLSENVDCEMDRSSSDCSNVDNIQGGQNLQPNRLHLPTVERCLQFVDSFCERIKRGINSRPELFVPPISMMQLHVDSYPANDVGLLNALCVMGYNRTTTDCAPLTD